MADISIRASARAFASRDDAAASLFRLLLPSLSATLRAAYKGFASGELTDRSPTWASHARPCSLSLQYPTAGAWSC